MGIKKRKRPSAIDIANNAQRKIKKRKTFKRKLYLFLLDATNDRTKRIAIYVVLVLLVILLISAIIGVKNVVSSMFGKDKETTIEQTEKGAKQEKVDIDALVKEVRESAKEEGVPEDIIEMLDKNQETVYFVRDYFSKKDNEIAQDLGDSFEAGKIPQILQWDERWGYHSYGAAHIGGAGCGPTAISMVLAGLTNDPTITPAKIAKYSEKNHFIDENNSTYWAIMENVAAKYGVTCEEFPVSQENIQKEMKDGKPVICSVGEGDFTTQGHFIVLVGEKNGKLVIHDPFSQINSDKLWKYERVVKQVKASWRFYIKE